MRYVVNYIFCIRLQICYYYYLYHVFGYQLLFLLFTCKLCSFLFRTFLFSLFHVTFFPLKCLVLNFHMFSSSVLFFVSLSSWLAIPSLWVCYYSSSSNDQTTWVGLIASRHLYPMWRPAKSTVRCVSGGVVLWRTNAGHPNEAPSSYASGLRT